MNVGSLTVRAAGGLVWGHWESKIVISYVIASAISLYPHRGLDGSGAKRSEAYLTMSLLYAT